MVSTDGKTNFRFFSFNLDSLQALIPLVDKTVDRLTSLPPGKRKREL